ncbi:PEPxxWA-CTERM sorting domain-containing protein [Phenylobacterium sp.]|uniref:PEPxxWA-CTERM sorting domain-containing protein n=1 Tax=Phenylobacterium sp. TaxID=1871053 RepID=UPI00374DA062
MRNSLLGAAASLVLLAAGAAQAGVTTYVYNGHTQVGGGAPFSDLVGVLNTPGISFGTDTGFNWHPFGLFDFGTDSFGTVVVAADGIYTFDLSSDDGSQVFIDGNSFISRPGPHGPDSTSGTIFLSAGVHAFEVQFFECCGGPSGLDFDLANGVVIGGGVPEPASWALMLTGFFGLGGALRHARKAKTATT